MILLNGFTAAVGFIILFTNGVTANNDGKEYQSCHYLESTDQYVCYSLFKDHKNWTQAKHNCESSNKKMARPFDAQRNGWIENLQRKAGTGRVWLPIRETGKSWDELSKRGIYVGWGLDKPDSRMPYEACAVLESKNAFVWDDRRCTQEHGFICSLGLSSCDGPTQVLTKNGCLQVYNKSMTWFSARARCRQHGGDLAIITSKETQKTLVNFLTKIQTDDMNFWINFIRRQWKWVDTGTELNFFAWESGQPNLEDQSCVVMVDIGTWLDLHCSDEIPYVCESYRNDVRVPVGFKDEKLSLSSPLVIFGLAVSMFVLVFCIVLAVVLLRKRRRKKEQENEERRVYMLEHDPRYADRVILTRAPRFTPTSYATNGQWVWKETDPTSRDTQQRKTATDA